MQRPNRGRARAKPFRRQLASSVPTGRSMDLEHAFAPRVNFTPCERSAACVKARAIKQPSNSSMGRHGVRPLPNLGSGASGPEASHVPKNKCLAFVRSAFCLPWGKLTARIPAIGDTRTVGRKHPLSSGIDQIGWQQKTRPTQKWLSTRSGW
jgi:hypothetical protein